MCPFQHWLTTIPIIAALTPNYASYLLFVLQAKHRYHCVLFRAKQFFRKIDGDNTIAACHNPFLTSPVKMNYELQKRQGLCRHKHPLSCTYLVKFSFSWNDGRRRFLRPRTLTAHLSNNLWGLFYMCHSRLYTSLWFCTSSTRLMDVLPVCFYCKHAYNLKV